MQTQDLIGRSINTLRTLSIDAVERARSGHPGLPLGAAPMAYVLWQRHLRHNPADPGWPDRDRFVLSAGHGSMLLYSLLHMTGYDLTMDDLQSFRQWGSKTPGHPERCLTPGVEATTGPLGQGVGNAVGMAMAERFMAHRYNRPGHTIVDHYTYALVSDGDLMEGVAAEAVSLAGHLQLGKLIFLYDANEVTLDGPASLSFSGEDVGRRFAAYGWQVLRVENGDTDVETIDAAIREAKSDRSRPSIVLVRTTIGFGSPNKAGKSEAHGAPLGEKEVELTKKQLGWDASGPFGVPDDVREHFRSVLDRGRAQQAQWRERFSAFRAAHPDLARQWEDSLAGRLPRDWDADLPSFAARESVATRVAGGKALNALAARIPWLLGGDADLSCSTKTLIAKGGDFDGQAGSGRNIHFGVREHAMGAICNGLDYHGGIRPYAATFFVFSDYMRPAVRLAALNERPIVYIWTHDSIAVGEDGPTHQPVEHLMSLRAMPHLAVVRPADGNETIEAWRYALQRSSGPTALILSRQDLPVIDRTRCAPASGLARGAYVLADFGGAPQAIVIATGSEVWLALAAAEQLAAQGIAARVVSMPCWEQFASEERSYRDNVLLPHISCRVSVEAGATFGWEKWLGPAGVAIGVDRFGASAPGDVNHKNYGFTVENIVATVRRLREQLAG